MRSFLLPLLAAALAASPVSAGDLPEDWAYRPFTRPAVPSAKDRDSVRTPVDAFLLAKLEAKGLSYATPADRRTLIRRVTFDLTGLPPTPAEVEAFLQDRSPNAFEKVVDRLLASPQYGERQALFWLDLVRFAESDGFKADEHRPHAWRYRDYVIRSFNADKPYDRFVKEQIAGDELFRGDLDAIVATGFLRHYPYEYNAVNLEQKRQDILNDITDTTAGSFLGLTLGCSKCHDHKTDPISQYDYYRFQAFFAGYWPVETPLMSPAELKEYEKKLAAWEEETTAIRAEMAKIEAPYRERLSKRERGRFPKEYADLLDIPFAERTPVQRQLGQMIDKQVHNDKKFNPSTLKGADKERWQALDAKLDQFDKDRPASPQLAQAMTDVGPVPPPAHLLKRGNWRNPSDELVPGYLSIIDDRNADTKPTKLGTSGRRAALANWIADEKNPLTARVMVNRLWQQHFGTGIVATPSDFGVTGERPTHVELLNWLASEFMENGWSLKKVHRLIVLSAAYLQSTGGETTAAEKADPSNSLLWHFPRQRLDGEALRDAMLATAGVLNPKAGGPSIFPELPAELKSGSWKVSSNPAERNRRSIYVFVKRNLRYPFFTLFDSPERSDTCARRFVSTTAPQALTLLNDDMVLDLAKKFAERVKKDAGADPDKVIDRAFIIALCRPPTTEEHAVMAKFLKDHKGSFDDAVTDLCHGVLNLNEFLYVD